MEIINNSNPLVKINNSLNPPRITFGHLRNRISFNVKSIRMFGFKYGDYIHFATDVDRIYFFINDDNSGIPIRKDDDEGLRINSVGVFAILMKKFPAKISPGTTFDIRLNPSSINGNKTYEILLHKRKLLIKQHKPRGKKKINLVD